MCIRDRIRSATLQVLETVGVHLPSPRALDIMAQHGARVDWQRQVVRLPPDLVVQAMGKAPRSYVLGGRAEGTALTLDGTCTYFATDGCGTETLDPQTGRPRRSCKEDVARMARVADALSSVAFYWPVVSAQDYGPLAPLHELDASFLNTVKHVQTETVMGAALARYAVEMARVIAGDEATLRARPPMSLLVCTIAPLAQDRAGIEGAMVMAEAGIPVGFMSMPNIGATAPATVAGALIVGNAEVVSAMVLIQLLVPGAPVYHSILASVMDPRSGEYIVSIPEKYLANAAAVQLAHDWGVPALGGAFGMDDVAPATWRLGQDSVYTALLVPLAGAEMVTGGGLLRASTLLVPEQLLFDDEIYHVHRRLLEGIDTSPESLAQEVISTVGPRGNFLAQGHTRRHIRHVWLPPLGHPAPVPAGQPTPEIRLRAQARLEQILAEHQPEPLPPAARAELQSILEAAARELAPAG